MKTMAYILALMLPSAALAQAPTFDATLIPPGTHSGYSVDRVQPATEQPRVVDGSGSFRIICGYSHMNQDDAIVYPGMPGRAHLHTYFGNTLTNYASTRASLRSTGNSTCTGGTVNRSAYWTPSMIDTRDGRPIAPKIGFIYYKSGFHNMPLTSIQPMPAGLRMISGNMHAMGPNTTPSWDSSHVHRFWCHPEPQMSGETIANCPAGSELWMSVTFPQCWDGQNLNSRDHKSHMSFRVEGHCPPSHPVLIPEISIHVIYDVTEANTPMHWRLSSDHYANTLPAGYSAHADWFNGWKTNTVELWTNNCLRTGLDCVVGLLGNGRTLY